MHHFFIRSDHIREPGIVIDDPGDINHIKNVLRLRPGERITLSCEDKGKDYTCVLDQVGQEKITALIEDIDAASGEIPVRLILFQGLAKGDKMDVVIQKAVELGAAGIVPVAMKRSVVKLDAKKAEKRQKRWREIAKGAASQSKRSVIPFVYPVMDFDEALEYAKDQDIILFPYEDAEGLEHSRQVIRSVKGKKGAAIFIGPEGGFDDREVRLAVEAGAYPITLGHRILRTETAGMAILSILMFLLDEDPPEDSE